MATYDLDLEKFHVDITEAKLDSLRQKLSLAAFPDELDDAEWDYGVPLDVVKRLITHWSTKFDWRAQERRINSLPQYLRSVEVDGFGPIPVHFVYRKSSGCNAIPLLFVHGWPGLFLEVEKLLQDLTDHTQSGPSFDVVAPSLPNFGFSPAIRKRGFAIRQYAELCHKLMHSLGYPQYVTQGGDWGYLITRMMGYMFPSSCKASHVNITPFTAPSWRKNPILALQSSLQQAIGWPARDSAALARIASYFSEGNGYMVLQSTKPQTLAYGLADSPVALLAWIVEKLYSWTDGYPWTDDEILTWVSIYWFSNSGPSAHARIYYEVAHDKDQATNEIVRAGWVPQVLYGVAFMPGEPIACPKLWARQMGSVVHESEADHGGHFPAVENPSFIVEDLRKMFGRGGGAYHAVSGRSGY